MVLRCIDDAAHSPTTGTRAIAGLTHGVEEDVVAGDSDGIVTVPFPFPFPPVRTLRGEISCAQKGAIRARVGDEIRFAGSECPSSREVNGGFGPVTSVGNSPGGAL